MFLTAERRAGGVGGVISTITTKGRTHRDSGSAIGDSSTPPEFEDATVADAVLDRIVHTSRRIEIQGESMRKLLAPPKEAV